MSSHREAPEISKDPVADSTDLYAFVSPDSPATVTLIANYIPLEAPGGGPNFYEFSDDVLYDINIDNNGDGFADISFQFKFTTVNNIPSSFLYNDGPITSLTPPSATSLWNRQQTYELTRIDWHKPTGKATLLGRGLLSPPCNIGPLSTPNYPALANAGIQPFNAGGYSGVAFAGQRAEGFYVDLGALFDLGNLRPFAADHEGAKGILANMPGVNSTAAVNVHTLAIQVEIEQLTSSRSIPSSVTDPAAVIGVWTTASRQQARVNPPGAVAIWAGPYNQVSRLGNPLVNEAIIGIGDKDRWNNNAPITDGTIFLEYFQKPLLATLLPTLYPGVFPNLAAYNATGGTRADIEAILLTGIPSGIVPGFTNYNGTGVKADQLRLNVAIPPTAKPSNLGLVGGDLAGFPNGRRVFDDIATIVLRAVAGATLPLVDKTFTADTAAGAVGMELTTGPTDVTAMGTANYLSSFPYLGTPYSGYDTPSKTPPVGVTT